MNRDRCDAGPKWRAARIRRFVSLLRLVNERDLDHPAVADELRRLIDARQRFFTTNFVVAETHALVLARINRDVAAMVLRQIAESRLTTIVRASAGDERRAREIIEQYADKSFSLTDAVSFAVMERLGIQQALTLDQHFVQYGWSVLPLERSK